MGRWQKTSRRPRKKRRPQHVWRLTHWWRYEPSSRYRKNSEPSSLPYVRLYINTHRLSGGKTVERSDIDHDRQKMVETGGWALLGLYYGLLTFAGDRAQLRGYLLNRDDKPATPAEIARRVAPASPQEIKEALRQLSRIGLAERVPYSRVRDLLLSSKADNRDACKPPVGSGPGGEPDRQGAPKEGRPPDGVVSSDGRADSREDSRDDARPNININQELPASAGKRGNSASLAGGGNAGKQKQKTEPANGPGHEGAGGAGQPQEPGNDPPEIELIGDYGNEHDSRNSEPPADADEPACRTRSLDESSSQTDANRNAATPGTAQANSNGPPRAGAREPAGRSWPAAGSQTASEVGPGTTADPPPPRHEADSRARDGASNGPTPSSSDRDPRASCRPPDPKPTSENVPSAGGRGRKWIPPGLDELPSEIDRLVEHEIIEATGYGWDDIRHELGHATKFGQVISKAIGAGVGRASQDEIHAFAQRWDCVLEAPIAEGLRIWWFEKMFALAVEMNERRMKEVRGGRTDPPNYRRIWMAEAKRCLQAVVTAGAQNCRPP